MKAMIFAAGLGTRLRPITDTLPKALVPINGVPLLEIAIRNLIRYGYREVVVNVHHFADQIVDFLRQKDNFGIVVHLSDERDELLETGGGLLKAAPLLRGDAPFLVWNADVVSDIDLGEMQNFHLKTNALATLAVAERNTSRKLLFDKNMTLRGWENTKTGEIRTTDPDPNRLLSLGFSGIHLIEPRLLDLITHRGKFSIIEPYLDFAHQKLPIKGFRHENSAWVDVGKPTALAAASQLVATWNWM